MTRNSVARRGRTQANARVRVRTRGSRRELRVDGTLASSFTPGRVTTHSVWDALAASLLALPAARRRRVLLVGLGAGSAARVARALAPDAEIVGVELDAAVVEAARAWFDLDALGIEVVIADARDYLASRGRPFDAVLEDVFIGVEAELRKPEGFPLPALDHARRRLAPGGVLASNTIDEGPAVRRALGERFECVVEIGVAEHDNRIYVATDAALSARALRAAVAADPFLSATLPVLRFRTP
jgi:spermidine synthase